MFVRLRWLASGMAMIAVAAVVCVPGLAAAGSRTLWQSDDFSVRGALVGTKLILTHTNRTDYWIHFRCRFTTSTPNGTERHRTSGELTPGEAWRKRFRHQERLPSKTACRVSVNSSDTILWRSDDFVVLAYGFSQPDGTPQTNLWFVNKTKAQLHRTCSWWSSAASSPETYPQVWSPILGGYDYSNLSEGGVALASIQGFVCAPYTQGVPYPVTVPSGVTTLFDSGTFLVTEQAGFIVNNQYWLRFINRLDSAVNAACSWTQTSSDGSSSLGTWQQVLSSFGIGGLGIGSQPSLTFTGMTCNVTPGQ